MKCKLVIHKELSGNYATIYSLSIENCKNDKLEEFIRANFSQYRNEVADILARLRTIGQKSGANEFFFKHNEGKLGDGVCALYDKPNSKLRLYCIRNGSQIVIVGSGGVKPKNIKAYQENPKLKSECELMQSVSLKLTELINDTLKYSKNGLLFEGELEFELD